MWNSSHIYARKRCIGGDIIASYSSRILTRLFSFCRNHARANLYYMNWRQGRKWSEHARAWHSRNSANGARAMSFRTRARLAHFRVSAIHAAACVRININLHARDREPNLSLSITALSVGNKLFVRARGRVFKYKERCMVYIQLRRRVLWRERESACVGA